MSNKMKQVYPNTDLYYEVRDLYNQAMWIHRELLMVHGRWQKSLIETIDFLGEVMNCLDTMTEREIMKPIHPDVLSRIEKIEKENTILDNFLDHGEDLDEYLK